MSKSFRGGSLYFFFTLYEKGLGKMIQEKMLSLEQPLAVFDSGIGSYGVVKAIQEKLPMQDILYLADRASFPYGGKNRNQLVQIMEKTIDFLSGYHPSGIVIASNAPSIMVLEELKKTAKLPLFGVYPPLEEALKFSKSKHVGIMAVKSLVESDTLDQFIRTFSRHPENVAKINASPMVELVESGMFQFDPVETQKRVDQFIQGIQKKFPEIDVLTLSSTHLPWLREFFESAWAECTFLDPVETIIESLGGGTAGSGKIQGLVTESEGYDIATFKKLLEQLGADIPISVVEIK